MWKLCVPMEWMELKKTAVTIRKGTSDLQQMLVCSGRASSHNTPQRREQFTPASATVQWFAYAKRQIYDGV